jgi:hypothetical protein
VQFTKVTPEGSSSKTLKKIEIYIQVSNGKIYKINYWVDITKIQNKIKFKTKNRGNYVVLRSH